LWNLLIKIPIWGKFAWTYLLIEVYLCGTTTNIWLRPVEGPLGPGCRCSPHPPTWISVFFDFSFHWVWLWIELIVVGLRVFWSCDQLNAICLSPWHLGHSGCQTLFQVRGCIFSCRHHVSGNFQSWCYWCFTKCTIYAKLVDKTMTYPSINNPIRTNQTFRDRAQLQYHHN
jgi:hypothetical protein